MTQLNPYIHFNGKCREAMTFYHACLGGDLMMQKISESPMAAQLPSEMGANILHSSLTKGAITIMASDMSTNPVRGNDVTLCLNCTNDDELNIYFTKLSVGGKIKTQLHQTFWGATYGEITDKFGMNWMFSYMRN
ncbi:MAG TPA: VOC family protein [Cyclobacteriaceae bacterium]|jgi:PhnB protein|nr:VOC family protein [Cyclobacteriaceae bacterium]